MSTKGDSLLSNQQNSAANLNSSGSNFWISVKFKNNILKYPLCFKYIIAIKCENLAISSPLFNSRIGLNIIKVQVSEKFTEIW